MTSGIYMLIASLFFSVLRALLLPQTRSGSYSIFAKKGQVGGVQHFKPILGHD